MITSMPLDIDAQLRMLTGRADATFRAGQREAVEALALRRERVVLVQRTGWGKSAVYFLSTRVLRDAGLGPTIIVSPLLALMRNQLEAAQRLGLRAEAINSTNPDDHDRLRDQLNRDEIDLLLVAPERLANQKFVSGWLPMLLENPGLLVIDEVHCISDWGHDFRPDYRRLRTFVDRLPAEVPVLGCTATANDRVVADVSAQLGATLVTQRGPLDRPGLHLAVLDIPSAATRLAWLVEHLPTLPGTGIVYCLTIADTRVVADFLNEHGINVLAYSGDDSNEWRIAAEDHLLRNEVKALIATSALGMGFDKPDLGFVVHYQAPGTPVAYYQQVGRAGRALDESFGVLLRGKEDAGIQNYFIDAAFPEQHVVERVLDFVGNQPDPPGIPTIETAVNLSRGRLGLMLKQLEVDGAVARSDRGGYYLTAQRWSYPHERYDQITGLRRAEQAQMDEYATTDQCRMRVIRSLLDDPTTDDCGICDRCRGERLSTAVDAVLVTAARKFLRTQPVTIEPRTQWPSGLSAVRGRISGAEVMEPGRAVCRLGDGELGTLLRADLAAGAFGDELIEHAVLTLTRWNPLPRPMWITYVPSRRHGDPVGDFARRLAEHTGLPCHAVVEAVGDHAPQADMNNSAQQVRNVLNAFAVTAVPDTRPVLLIDDTVSSRWTLTTVARQLRRAGASSVLPLVIGG